ncbi:esterase-like activity of phytase family protein [Actinomadura sp. ATCC 31491]|uniref:Esterase-like activity of phytase family protein n=1 Tax=Actinomadura luzonensis TaxID=2805427 RepID=A0ABT0FYK8_9ACTN|nr:esterase-like activity of phytase family protein [Actinomadura luzonensis]MCK2217430.1 esterase-like activity of phytase family protein [Actinomadura luzonensis]
MRSITLLMCAGAAALSLAAPAAAAAANPTTGPTAGAAADRGRPGWPAAFGQATLTGFAALPAQTYVPGSEPSGSALGTAPVNGITPPFPGQPVQGFSGIVRRGDGTYEVLSDNGFGNKANSSDFLLRVHHIKPDFRDKSVKVLGGFNLTDPRKLVPFALTRQDRTLTGADFDVESIVRTQDGTYWIGDEFGPYLLHFDRKGRLMDAPVALPGVRAPENPELNGAQPNLASSKGFEGMARGVDGRHLYPLLEGTVAGDPEGTLRMNEFDLRTRSYTGRRWTYRLDSPAHAIGDAVAVDADRFLVIERDNAQGDAAQVKRVYLADRRDRDGDGTLDKTLVADLLNLADPRGLAGAPGTFRFPFQTIEDVAVLDDRTLAVLDDNNFPFSNGRTAGRPDDNEFITVRLARGLQADPRVRR